MILVGLLLAVSPQTGGQIGKFENKRPVAEYDTRARLEDVERCLVRFGSPPAVYRQPDRPDDVMIVWSAGGVSAGNATGRVDLKRAGQSTHLRAWLPVSAVEQCAPH